MGKLYDLRYDYCKEEWPKRRTGTDEEWEHANLVGVAEYAWPPANPYLAALEAVAIAARALLRRAEGISPDDLLGSVLSLIEWIEWPELRDALDVLDNALDKEAGDDTA